ncbi:unnamed protein product [Onchocerca flexuosa]|uniref:Uncharacterized protein n=1 Tax=Onchocerca flexuosa TaxID=387005 RepID=A0A183I6V8_9BILA|nr:unnamed protein product [Onchocerca flexuosa]
MYGLEIGSSDFPKDNLTKLSPFREYANKLSRIRICKLLEYINVLLYMYRWIHRVISYIVDVHVQIHVCLVHVQMHLCLLPDLDGIIDYIDKKKKNTFT